MESDNQLDHVKLEEVKEEIIRDLTDTIRLYGLSPSESRLYGTIFIEDQPMTLDQMSKSLGMSKTAMSNGIRSLLEAKMVERVWKKGVRKDLYKVEDDLIKSFSNSFIQSWKQTISHHKQGLIEKQEQLIKLEQTLTHDQAKQEIAHYLHKIEEILAFYDWLGRAFTQMDQFER